MMPVKAISGRLCAHSHCQYLVFLIEIGQRSHKAVGISIEIANDVGVPRAGVKLLGREIKQSSHHVLA
jgi:hypothetical protein